MTKLYVVMREILNDKGEVEQGDCLYEGYNLKAALKSFEIHDCDYKVNKSKRQYAKAIAYDYIYLEEYVLDRMYDLKDFDEQLDLSEYLIETPGKMIINNNMCELKKVRILNSMSQSQLAQASGVPVRTIQDYEQGNRDIKKAAFETVCKLADALNISVDRLIN